MEGCKLATIGEPVRDMLSELIDCMKAMGGNATMEDFNKWQKAVKGN